MPEAARESDHEPAPRPRRWRRRLRRVVGWAAALYVAAAFTATHVPNPPTPGGVPHLDKLVHAGIFFGLAPLVAAWRVTRFDRPGRAALTTLLLCLAYAAADELTQGIPGLTDTRTPNALDFLADVTGTLLGLAAFGPLLRWWRRAAR